jgi:hypothetical protein
MKTGLIGLCGLVMAIGFVGCDDSDPVQDTSSWVVPADVNGHWRMEPSYTDQVGYCHKITVHQAGTNAAVVYNYSCEDETNYVENAHPASYDPEKGILTVQYDLNCWKDYFRFTSATNMWRVSDPTTNVVHGVPYFFKRPLK